MSGRLQRDGRRDAERHAPRRQRAAGRAPQGGRHGRGAARARRIVPALAAACVLVAAGAAYWLVARRPPAPQVILIVIDTVRADSFGCYGSTRGATPNIDALAREAVRFEQAIGHAPWTLSSVASLLTSTHPTIHGARGKQWRFDRFTGVRPGVTSGAEAFRDAGFRTQAIVNAVFLDHGLGLDRGFEVYDLDPATNVRVRRVDACVDLALSFLRENRGRRGFLLLHLFDPHLRYDPLPQWAARFAGDYRGPLRSLDPQALEARTNAMREGDYVPGPEERAFLENLHLAELACVDHELGRFFEGLRAMGLYERSTIVVTADHGEEFWDHGGFEHGHTLYDELVRLPLIVKPPWRVNGDAPRVVREQVRQLDVMPTLLDLAGIAPPATFEGRSFRAALEPTAGPIEPRDAYIEEPHYHRLEFDVAATRPSGPSGSLFLPPPVISNELIALRAGGYKYVLDVFSGAQELYHVAVDPREALNLIDREPQRAAELRARLLTFAESLLERAEGLAPAPAFDMHEDYFRALQALGYVREVPGVAPDWSAPDKAERIRALRRGN